MYQVKEFPKDNTQALLNRLEEAQQLVSELARIILPKQGDFRSVWDITNSVVDTYYRPKVRAA
ncbi:MAG TPA: hypothetical protein VLK33_14900 [Terriglobales bacterium]|nr:hypothetical protein [Terriglobales bacterium]